MLIDIWTCGFRVVECEGRESKTSAAHLRRLHDVLLACLLNRHWLAWVLEGGGARMTGDGWPNGQGGGNVISSGTTYLCRVHFELADHFDGHFGVLSVVVLGAVNIAEGAVAHLLDQSVSLQTGVTRQLALAFTLLGNNALEDRAVIVFLLTLALLLIVYGTSCGVASLGSDASVVYCRSRVVVVRCAVTLDGLVVSDIWFADGWCKRGGVVTAGTRVDIGNLGGRLGLR